jgi:hypothetical protein
MKLAASLLLLFVVADAPTRLEPAIPYFTKVRQVQIAEPDRQNFFVVDQEIWNNSRPDLGDLRLYDSESPVPFAISEQRAGISSEEVEAKVLNLGSVSGHTEFDLDAESLTEYDRIRLRLDVHDFIATASVSGGSAPGKATEVELTNSTLYDFSKEQLGSNFQLKLPTSSFRYLHIKLSPGIRPQQVNSAAIYDLHEQQASWTKVGSCAAPQNKPHLTVIACNLPEKVPLSRILFHVDPAQVNFRRTVSLEDAKGQQFASGEISRVRINRAGTLVTDEELSLNVFGNRDAITIKVDNGDNPPLAVTALEPLAVERRVYFDPRGKTALALYYGDHKLSAPIYDYARFFHADAAPAEAQLAAAAHNPQYVGRPDERPWSDRHTGILWTAMIAAVLALTVLALRGLRPQSAP